MSISSAPTQSPDDLFHSFTVLCENQNFLISSLHCCFANAASRSIIIPSSSSERNIFINIFTIIQYDDYDGDNVYSIERTTTFANLFILFTREHRNVI